MAETFISRANLETTPAGESQPLSVRAFLLGSLLCLLIGVGTIYANAIIQGTFMAWCFSNPVALFLFFYLGWAISWWHLGSQFGAEAGRVGADLRHDDGVGVDSTFGLVEHLLPMITGVFYYATPENNWVN